MDYYYPKYFDVKELVSERMYKFYGVLALAFLDKWLLKDIDNLRSYIGSPFYVNNWSYGGTADSRGYRDPYDPEGAILSQHKFGRAIDFTVKGMEAEEVRQVIIKNKNDYPNIYRLEKKVNWVHADRHPNYKTERITLFNPS